MEHGMLSPEAQEQIKDVHPYFSFQHSAESASQCNKAIKEKKKQSKRLVFFSPTFEETVNNQSSIKHCRNYLSANHQVA